VEPRQRTAPATEEPDLSQEERERRLRLLAERLVSPEGFDRETLAQVEALTGQDR